jgi:hypothetical protein
MAAWYLLAHDTAKAKEAEEKAIEWETDKKTKMVYYGIQ